MLIETAERFCVLRERRLHGDVQGLYLRESNLILLDCDLTSEQRRCVLAHEISHARHLDEGCHARCDGVPNATWPASRTPRYSSYAWSTRSLAASSAAWALSTLFFEAGAVGALVPVDVPRAGCGGHDRPHLRSHRFPCSDPSRGGSHDASCERPDGSWVGW